MLPPGSRGPHGAFKSGFSTRLEASPSRPLNPASDPYRTGSKLGTIGRHQLAALVGVAPINRDSGLMRGRRSIAGGRTFVRGVLYMAALTAIRRGSPFPFFYERLTERGRPRVTLNAIVRDHAPWCPLTA